MRILLNVSRDKPRKAPQPRAGSTASPVNGDHQHKDSDAATPTDNNSNNDGDLDIGGCLDGNDRAALLVSEPTGENHRQGIRDSSAMPGGLCAGRSRCREGNSVRIVARTERMGPPLGGGSVAG